MPGRLLSAKRGTYSVSQHSWNALRDQGSGPAALGSASAKARIFISGVVQSSRIPKWGAVSTCAAGSFRPFPFQPRARKSASHLRTARFNAPRCRGKRHRASVQDEEEQFASRPFVLSYILHTGKHPAGLGPDSTLGSRNPTFGLAKRERTAGSRRSALARGQGPKLALAVQAGQLSSQQHSVHIFRTWTGSMRPASETNYPGLNAVHASPGLPTLHLSGAPLAVRDCSLRSCLHALPVCNTMTVMHASEVELFDSKTERERAAGTCRDLEGYNRMDEWTARRFLSI